MAAGDAVVGLSGANAALTFTPAAGVEVVITAHTIVAGVATMRTAAGGGAYTQVPADAHTPLCNVPITNSQGIYLDAGGGSIIMGYTGVQIK